MITWKTKNMRSGFSTPPVKCSSAARMLVYAYMPAAMSAMEGPALDGVSSVPVTETKPASLWISRS